MKHVHKALHLLIFLIFTYGSTGGQEFVYVNVKNLILRDRPEPEYMVFAVLQPPDQLKLEHKDIYYDHNKAVNNRFYQVSVMFRDEKGIGHFIGGWVEKKYTVRRRSAITVPGVDSSAGFTINAVNLISFIGADEDDPNEWNYRSFPYPLYKGGEKQFPNGVVVKRTYHMGPRGGCYYLAASGRKVYVDARFCEKKTKHPQKK